MAGLLDGPRARGAFLLRMMMHPPWSIRVEDQAPLTLLAPMTGAAWIVPDDGDAQPIRAGDIALVRGPDPVVVADDPATAPQVFIKPGPACTSPEGKDLHDVMNLGVRSWGNDPSGSTTIFVGTYQMTGEISGRLLGALPALLVLPHQSTCPRLLDLLAGEIVKDDPGQEVVLDRLVDLVLVAALRDWFSRPEAAAPSWYRALGDPVVGPAIRMLQDDPARPWTVASLASASGVSRAVLARRFAELVGEPPMTYLAGWRLALAADLLRDTDASLGAVARQVGYGSPFALSAAFKRVLGVSPQQHRLGLAG